MTQYVFMNHRIREKKPSGPVIVVQDELTADGPRQRESNSFDIWYHGDKIGRIVFDLKLLQAVDSHEVKAWVEFDDLVILSSPEDRKPRKPIAAEKTPNKPVRT